MTTKLPDDGDDGLTGAQLATFRDTENVNIHGGNFSITYMDSGRETQAHNANTSLSGPHRSTRGRDKRRPYPINHPGHIRQHGCPEPSLTTVASARNEQHQIPTTVAPPTISTGSNPSQRAAFGKADVVNVSGGNFPNTQTVQLFHGFAPEGSSHLHTQDYLFMQEQLGRIELL